MATTSTPTFRNSGVSPYITITSENIRSYKFCDASKVKFNDVVQPPKINTNVAISPAISNWIQTSPIWNYERVVEPKFDGICKKIGTISNRPDPISNYHFIGLMRDVDRIIAPQYDASISASVSGSPSFTPPAGRS
jgi:hypothetical protein